MVDKIIILEGDNIVDFKKQREHNDRARCPCEEFVRLAFSKAVHQTISVPRLKAAEEDELWLDGLRREQGCQKRTSYNACFTPRISENGVPGKIVAGRLIREWDKRDEKSVRHEIMGKHKPIVGDHWTAHCAVREGIAAREASPDGKAVFGSRGELERRSKGLSTPQEWQRMRLVPFVSYGRRQDSQRQPSLHLGHGRRVRTRDCRQGARHRPCPTQAKKEG